MEHRRWYGIFQTGSKVVYDPTCQALNSPYVLLFVIRTSSYRAFKKENVRALLSPIKNGSEKHELSKKYDSWLQEKESLKVRSLAMAQLQEDTDHGTFELRERHKRFLETIGKSAEAKAVGARSHRSTHCYACKCSLSSTSNLECTSCKWLICGCGACGCGYGVTKLQQPPSAQSADTPDEYYSFKAEHPQEDRDREFEHSESKREIGEFIQDLSRSEDDGWFYSDNDYE